VTGPRRLAPIARLQAAFRAHLGALRDIAAGQAALVEETRRIAARLAAPNPPQMSTDAARPATPSAGAGVQDDLIFDLGANHGEDTEFYLDKGFRVVAVEANPVLFAQLSGRFASAMARGQLVLLNVGIWSEARTLPFYVNEENDHWSSFDPAYGARDGTRHQILEIPCLTAPELLRRFGVPRYMKIDIEGADRLVLAQMGGLSPLPRYVSIEEYGVGSIHDLAALGYARFQIVPQRDKSWAVPPDPPREGRLIRRQFNGTDSGLFGAELPGAWLDLRTALAVFTSSVRRPDGTYVGPPDEWFDVHAAL
jgi:FkbM family methyltransferase